MKQLNERTSAVLALSFTDLVGKKVVPISGKYQIVDKESGTILKVWTDFAPSLATYEININEEYNRIIDDSNNIEVRIVSIVVQYSLNRQTTSEFWYEIINLYNIPPTIETSSTGGYSLGGTALIVGTHI